MIAGIVLAAGGSARMGRNKMLLPAAGGTLLSRAVDPLREAGLERVVVVLGRDAEAVRRSAPAAEDPRLRYVVNENWHDGMASSLRSGLEACADCDAVLIALGDQPELSAERIRRVVRGLTPGVRLVVPVHGGVPAHPVLFARSLFPELEALTGDIGAREVVRRHWDEALRIEMDLLGDIDTEEDYERFLEGEDSRS